MSQWYFNIKGKLKGPFDYQDLVKVKERGYGFDFLKPETPVRKEGDENWRPARETELAVFILNEMASLQPETERIKSIAPPSSSENEQNKFPHSPLHEEFVPQTPDPLHHSAEKSMSWQEVMKGVIGLIAVVWLIWNTAGSFFPKTGGDSEACKVAELHVKNSVYTSAGIIPKTESTVVYKNKDYICVGVNYTFGDNFDDHGYWARVVYMPRGSSSAYGSTTDMGGVNIHKLSKEQIDQIKVLFKLD